MWFILDISRYRILLVVILLLVLMNACESESPDTLATAAASDTASQSDSAETLRTDGANERAVIGQQQSGNGQHSRAEARTPIGNAVNPQFPAGSVPYMFDISNHSQEELVVLGLEGSVYVNL